METLYNVEVNTINYYIKKIFDDSELQEDAVFENFKDHTIKGCVMDAERIKRGTYLTDKYFEEQLERVREIGSSERKFYQKVTDLYAASVDYDKTAAAAKRFYATVQNKMHLYCCS